MRGERVGRLLEMLTFDRRMLSGLVLLPVAMVHNDFWRALDQKDLPTVRRGVQGRHEPVLRFKRDDVDPGIGGLFLLPVEPNLGGERIQRALGRIALHLPDAVLATQLRVVAERGDTPQEQQNGILAYRRAILQHLALAVISFTRDLMRRVCQRRINSPQLWRLKIPQFS